MIKFNEVTWYSKLAAIIFFIGILPILTFYIGTQYESTKSIAEESVIATSSIRGEIASVKALPDIFFTDAIKDPELQDIKVLARGDINQDNFEDAIVIAYSCGAGCTYSLNVVLNNNNQSVNAKYMDFDGVEGSPAAFKSLLSEISINDGIISITGSLLDCKRESEATIVDATCETSENNQALYYKTIQYRFDGTKMMRLK